MTIETKVAEIEKELTNYNFSADIAEVSSREQVRCSHPEIIHLFGKNYKARDIASFLCQVKYYWDLKGQQPFHKFNTPCPDSAVGDSWEEELGMSKHDLKAIKKVVSTRVRNHREAVELVTNGTNINTLVVYYRNSKRVTFWYFNAKLYKILREMGKKMCQKSGVAKGLSIPWAQETENPLGLRDSQSLGNNTEILQRDKKEEEEEKESSKEKDFDALFETDATPLSKNPASEKKRAQRKATANKRTKALTPQQQSIINDQKKGRVLPLDFSPEASIMDELVKEGYVRDQLLAEAKAMIDWFQIHNPTAKKVNWGWYFKTKWVPKSQTLEKNGKILNKSANAKRADRLEEIATVDLYSDVGEEDFRNFGNELIEERGG